MQPSSVVSTLDISRMLSALQRPRVSPSVVNDKKKKKEKNTRRDLTLGCRVKRDSQLYNLTLDINDLKQEIHNLALRRQLLDTRALYESRLTSDCSVIRKAAHYFQGFSRGFRGPQTHVSQDAFVRSIADEDFSIGVTGLGVGMLLEQWRRYTELFHLHQTVIHSVGLVTRSEEDGDEPAFVLVKGVVSFHGVFTHEGVNMIFPSAKRDPVLMLQVLGQKLVCPMVFHLYFNARGQLVRHDADADFFSAVRRALGGDCDTAFRFMDALRLGQESMLGPIVNENEDGDTTAESQSSSFGSESGDGGDVCSSIGDQEPEDEHEADLENPPRDEKLKDGEDHTQRHSLAFLLSNTDN